MKHPTISQRRRTSQIDHSAPFDDALSSQHSLSALAKFLVLLHPRPV